MSAVSLQHLPWRLLLAWAIVLTSACQPEPVRREVPLPSEAYVWQRAWSPQVVESIGRARLWVQAFHLLAAEVRFEKNEMKATRIRVDQSALKGVKTGLVVRIFPSAAKTGWDERAVGKVVELAKELVAEWPAGHVAELQLDYDCPDSKLADYTRLLKAVSAALSPLPVTCTALPSWLRQKEFAPLAKVVPNYVLQVHSLHLPEARDRPVALVDLKETEVAVARAVEIGVPFRVALPTYSCVVEFDEKGKVREVYAEDVPAALPLQSPSYVVLDADAYGMADLVSKWRREAPPLLKSVVWYRLPVAGDRLNWRPEVLAKVALGEPLRRGWEARCEAREGGHREIVIEQQGDAPDDLPNQVRLQWSGPAAEAADGLRGYVVAESAAGHLVLRLADPGRMARAQPGTKRVVGWLRLEAGAKPVEISAETAR